MPAVTVVGSYNRDLIFKTRSLPRPGETLLGSLTTAHGGKGFNQAVAASRLGVDTVFLGAAGRDAAAAEAAQFARDNGLTGHWEHHDLPTGTAAIICDDPGENQIVVAPGANALLSPRHIEKHAAEIAASNVLLVQLECQLTAVERALQLARKHHTLAILNPAPMPPRPDFQLLRLADLLTPNESEFAAICRAANLSLPDRWAQLPADELHRICRSLQLPDIVITLGAGGGFFSLTDAAQLPCGRYSAPAAAIVDTTGAGDAFNGALAAALAERQSFGTALKLAAAAAAVAVTRLGAAPSMADRLEAGWPAPG